MSPDDFSFSCAFRVRYAEIDSQGIVFNGNYLTYFDVAITEYFRAKSLPYPKFVETHRMDFHVIHAEIDYKSPARADEEIRVCLTPFYAGPKVFWKIAIFRELQLLCSGEIVYVAVDTESGKIKRIPENIAAQLKLSPQV